MSLEHERLTLDDVAQFDGRLQIAVLAATARVYAAGIEADAGRTPEQRRLDARDDVDDYLQLVAPLITGRRD